MDIFNIPNSLSLQTPASRAHQGSPHIPTTLIVAIIETRLQLNKQIWWVKGTIFNTINQKGNYFGCK